MNIELLVSMLGWCVVINFVLLSLAAAALILGGDWVKSIHGKMFGLTNSELDQQYFSYLANYKILIIVFNLVPYLALRILLG